MNGLKEKIQTEYLRRASRNSRYSLRAFAKQIGISHATLSAFLSGKRKISKKAVLKLAPGLNLAPNEIERFMNAPDSLSRYSEIDAEIFSSISEWYFDAILELARIPNFTMTPKMISQAISISEFQAKNALDILIRIGLLTKKSPNRFVVAINSTNDIDPSYSSVAKIQYQRSILYKSLESIDKFDRSMRDHTSTTMAIRVADIPAAKNLIKEFRQKLDTYLQRSSVVPDQVYQLQVAFFPLSEISENLEQK